MDCHYNCVVVKVLVELFFLVFPLSHHSPFFSKINKNKQKKDWNDLQVVIDVKCFIWKDTSRSRLGQSCYGFQFQNSLIFFLTKHITDDPITQCSMQYPPTYLHILQKWTLIFTHPVHFWKFSVYCHFHFQGSSKIPRKYQ